MISIYEERLVKVSIDSDYFNVCDRMNWVMARWGQHNFRLLTPTPWVKDTMYYEFWVMLHPRDADRAIDEIWSAAQDTLDIDNLTPVPEYCII